MQVAGATFAPNLPGFFASLNEVYRQGETTDADIVAHNLPYWIGQCTDPIR
jgi:hypothetical protein